MGFPFVDLDSPTHLAVHWGWLLVTLGNLVVYLGLLVVFVLGVTVRLPGVRRDLAAAERARDRVTVPGQRTAPGEPGEAGERGGRP